MLIPISFIIFEILVLVIYFIAIFNDGGEYTKMEDFIEITCKSERLSNDLCRLFELNHVIVKTRNDIDPLNLDTIYKIRLSDMNYLKATERDSSLKALIFTCIENNAISLSKSIISVPL